MTMNQLPAAADRLPPPEPLPLDVEVQVAADQEWPRGGKFNVDLQNIGVLGDGIVYMPPGARLDQYWVELAIYCLIAGKPVRIISEIEPVTLTTWDIVESISHILSIKRQEAGRNRLKLIENG